MNGIALLDARFFKSLNCTALYKCTLEILQALVVLHIAAFQNALQPGSLHAEDMVLQLGDGKENDSIAITYKKKNGESDSNYLLNLKESILHTVKLKYGEGCPISIYINNVAYYIYHK